MGFENGVYWFKVDISEPIASQEIVFNIPENTIGKIEVYNRGKLQAYELIEETHSALLIRHSWEASSYVLKVDFKKQVHFPLSIRRYADHVKNKSHTFFKNGFFYGFILMVLVVNLFFLISLKDKTFLYYCFFIMAINFTFMCFDGYYQFVIPSSVTYHISVLSHFTVPLFGSFLAHHFLDLGDHAPKSSRVSIVLLVLIASSYISFFINKAFVFIAIGDLLGLVTLAYYWIHSILVLKKHDYAKFFTIGYSLVLFSAIFFVVPMNWGFNGFYVSLDKVKFGAVFEALILTYAISYRVQVLHKENQEYRIEIKNYVGEIVSLENNISKTEEVRAQNFNKKIDSLVKEYDLTEREKDVLVLISDGVTNQKIADTLFISVNTTKYHIKNIYLKLDIKNKSEAVKIVSA